MAETSTEMPTTFTPKKDERLDMVIEKLKDHIGRVENPDSSDEYMDSETVNSPTNDDQNTSLPIVSDENNFLNKSYLMWQNNANVCWLDASMALLVHNHTLMDLMDKSIPTQISSIIEQYHEAISLCNNLSDSDDKDVNMEAAKDILRTVQDSALKYLQPIVKFKEGVPDSAFCSLFNLIVENKSIKSFFEVEYTWLQQCHTCKTQRNKKCKKPIITLPRVLGFQPSCAMSLYQCSVCKSPDETMTLQFRTSPQCLLFHFERGAGKGELQCSNFKMNDDRIYKLTGVMTLQKGKESGFNHFVTFIRDPASDMWLECNDLDEGLSTFGVVPPYIQLSDVYIMMYEATDEKGSLPNSLPAEGESVEDELESGSEDIPMIDLDDEDEMAEKKSPEANNLKERKGLLESGRRDEDGSQQEVFFNSGLFLNAADKEYKLCNGGLFNRNESKIESMVEEASNLESCQNTTDVPHEDSIINVCGNEYKLGSGGLFYRNKSENARIIEEANVDESCQNTTDVFHEDSMVSGAGVTLPDCVEPPPCFSNDNLGSSNEKYPSPKSIQSADNETAAFIDSSTTNVTDTCENASEIGDTLGKIDFLSPVKSQKITNEISDTSLNIKSCTVQLNKLDHVEVDISSDKNITKSANEGKKAVAKVISMDCSLQPLEEVSKAGKLSLKTRKRKLKDINNVCLHSHVSEAAINEIYMENVVAKKVKKTQNNNVSNEHIKIPSTPTQEVIKTKVRGNNLNNVKLPLKKDHIISSKQPKRQQDASCSKAKSISKSTNINPKSQKKCTEPVIETANKNFTCLENLKAIDKKGKDTLFDNKLSNASKIMNPFVLLEDILKTSRNQSDKINRINGDQTVTHPKNKLEVSNNSSNKINSISNTQSESFFSNDASSKPVNANSFSDLDVVENEDKNSANPLSTKQGRAKANLKHKKLNILNSHEEGSNIDNGLIKKGLENSKIIKTDGIQQDPDKIKHSKIKELNLQDISEKVAKPNEVRNVPFMTLNKASSLKTAGQQKGETEIKTVETNQSGPQNANLDNEILKFNEETECNVEISHAPDCLCDTTEMSENLVDMVVDTVLRGMFSWN